MTAFGYGSVTRSNVVLVPTVRLALAQINPIVGDVAKNVDLCTAAVAQAAEQQAHIILLPEMVITGYPVEDLALRPTFQSASEAGIAQLAHDINEAGYGEHVVIAGYLHGTDKSYIAQAGVPHGAPMNCAAVIHRGQVVARYSKHHLPNYGVFDEHRYFVPGHEELVVRAFGCDIAVAICEDLWQDGGPVSLARESGVGLLAVINGSPYERDKDDVRTALIVKRAKEANAVLAYVNLVGGQDELVFDGDSVVVDAQGSVLARAAQFESDIMIVDVELAPAHGRFDVELPTTGWIPTRTIAQSAHSRLDSNAEVYHALVLGLKDYVNKNGFKSVLLGLSGGIDSAFVAALACDALGASRVFGVSLPSEYSSEHSKSDAYDLAQRTGINIRTVSIAPMVTAYLDELGLTGLAEENLQARVRGTTLMGISNQEGHLVLATGNKSELSVGYSTIYGDAVGGFAPIKDLPKVDVWELSRWRNDLATSRGEVPPIPQASISKPPSAELRPGQLDSDSLPDYEELDAILNLYVEQDFSADQIIARGFSQDSVLRALSLTDHAEYKRRQYPPGTKVSLRAFGRDRRLPMTNKWSEKPVN